MGGTLIINDQDDWLPANWLFNHVLALTAERLPPSAAGLKELLVKANTRVSGHGDLSGLDAGSFRVLVDAVARAREHAVAHPEEFGDPKFFPGFVRHFDELLAKLRADPRAAPPGA